MDDEGGDEVFPFLKADHPLLAKVQDALRTQLVANDQRVTLEVREKKEEYQKLVKHREEIGVTLYSAQRQLANFQLQLEQLHDKFAMTQAQRLEDDEELRRAISAHEDAKLKVTEAVTRQQKSKDELSQLNITLRSVQEYNEQMKAEINVTRRATYKSEDHIKGIEKEKCKQDLLIDGMNEDVRRMSERKVLLDAQIVAQKQETEAAIATLREASREMDAIEFEKKQLLLQWKSSLVRMQRRDEALQDVQKALVDQSEQELSVDNEIRGLMISLKEEQAKNEQLTALKDRHEKEQSQINTQNANIKLDREKLMDQYNMLNTAKDKAVEETRRMLQTISEHDHALGVIDKNVQSIARQATELMAKLEDESSEQLTTDRAASNSRKRMSKIREEIGQKEAEMQNLQNEIARVNVDSLNTKAHNQILKERLKQLSDELGEREELIEQYEQEIRKRHHQIEKKQLYVDRLNRDYDEKRTKLEVEAGEANVAGPLEVKIKSLKKSVADLHRECGDMQKDWIQKQTQLLCISTETDRLRTQVNDQKNRRMVLEQKKLRIEGQLEAQRKEVKDLNGAMKQLRFDMDRMNGSVVKHDQKTKDLTSANQMMETEFIHKLKEIEGKCLSMETSIENVMNEKNDMTQEIMEAERQVMLWDRKITLEKEMQDALDPNQGQADVTAMEKEIHRMELRFDQLKRRQEQMIMEMERAILKRDSIAQKYEPKAKKSKKDATTVNVKRQLQGLKNNLRLCTQANADAEQKISDREAGLADLRSTCDQAMEECAGLEHEVERVRNELQIKNIRKQRNLYSILKLQRTAKRLEDFARGTGSPVANNARAQYLEQVMLKKRIVDVVGDLRESYSHPQLDPLWEEFSIWLEVRTVAET